MVRLLNWNGKDLPEELRSLPAGQYVVEAVDEAPAPLTSEEEEGIRAALRSFEAGQTVAHEEVRQMVDRALKR